MKQLTLASSLTMQQAYDWIDANPKAWAFMVRFALQRASNGQRFGMKALVERVRWEMELTSTDGVYKLNNSLTAALARILVADYPALKPYISMRRSDFDREVAASNCRP